MSDELEIRREPFPERELASEHQAGLTEAEKKLAEGVEWSGQPYGRFLPLSQGRFFPLPTTSAMMVAVIGGVTLVFLGLGTIGGGIAMLVQKGIGGLVSSVGMTVFGAAMIAGAVVWIVAARRGARRRQRQPYGLFIFPDAVVLRHRVRGCERYPRARITSVERYKAFGGAGSSSQASGTGSTYARLIWIEKDGSRQERVMMDWPNDDQLIQALIDWR